MYKTILFAADFDEVGQLAAQKAKQLADTHNADLYLIHAVEPLPAYAYPGFSGFSDVDQALKENADKELNALGAKLSVPSDRLFLEIGATKNEVIRIAEELDADLIVAGSHGKHGIALLLGSSATAILHAAHCDVLIVRAKDNK